MAQTQVQTPDGQTITVEHPDGASDDEILAFAKQNHPAPAVGPDVAQSIAAAPRKVAEGMIGLPGTLQSGVSAAFDWLTGNKTPIPPSPGLPTPADIQAQTSKVLGPSYQPQTTPGKYAGAATEGVVGALMGPGTLGSKLAMGVGSGVGSEAAQQYFPGHPVAASLAGGLLGGIGTGLAAKGLEAGRNYAAANLAGQQAGQTLGTQPIPGGAISRIASSMRDDAITPASAAVTQSAYGNHTMLMDLGRQLQTRAEQIAQFPGVGQSTVLNAVEGRTGQYGSGSAGRIAQTLDSALGPSQNVVQLMDSIDKLLDSQARPAYQQVMSKYQNIPVPEPITQRPAVQTAMDQAQSIAANYGVKVSPDTPNLQYWDYVKKAMDQRINGMMRSGIDDLSSIQKADLGGLIDAKNRLVSHLDQATNGEYSAARQLAATKPELHDAYEFGQSIFNSKLLPEEVAAQVGDLSIGQQLMARVGARRELERVISNVRNEGAKARAFLDTDNNQQKISALFGPQAAKTISDRVAAENQFQAATQQVSQNSRTAIRSELQREIQAPSPADYHTTLTGLLSAPLKSGLGMALGHGMQKTREGMANLLTAQGPQIQQLVDQLTAYNQRRMANQLAPMGQYSGALARALIAQQAGR